MQDGFKKVKVGALKVDNLQEQQKLRNDKIVDADFLSRDNFINQVNRDGEVD